MTLFGRKRNRQIGSHLEAQAKKVFEQAVDLRRNYTNSAPWGEIEITRYFLKSFDNRGDLSSYVYEKGNRSSVEVKIDLVALAAACAGAPMPETPIFAEVGGSIQVERTLNNLLVCVLGPKNFAGAERPLSTEHFVVFLAMTGYKFDATFSLSAEVGVKTPDIPGMPKTGQGGGVGDNGSIEGGTYAELCAFECGAKASLQARASISGQRIYVSDPAPSFLPRDQGSIHELLMPILKDGDKKTLMKEKALQVFDDNPMIRALKPEKSNWKRHFSGGNITTKELTQALEAAIGKVQNDSNLLDTLQHHQHALADYKAQSVLKPYCFLALWGMKPEASAGMSAEAKASVKAGVGVAGAGAEAGVVLTGPSVATAMKFSQYRFQYCVGAKAGGRPRSNASWNLNALRETAPNQYIVVSQDTKITYGQIDITLLGVEGSANIGIQQGLINSKHQKSMEAGAGNASALGEAAIGGKLKIGLEETSASARAGAALKKTLQFMHYESAVAFWSPPSTDGKHENELRSVVIGEGSGFAFGQSVDIDNLVKHAKVSIDQDYPDTYVQGLCGTLGVTHEQIMKFLKSVSYLLEAFEDQKSRDPNMAPSAFLIETSFSPRVPGITVPVRWSSGAWKLGPFNNTTSTLRGIVNPQGHLLAQLQAIRLRYRISDYQASSRVRFSLGIKFIATLGIKLESVENAGSEGIINLCTEWFNAFEKYQTGAQTLAYDKSVPYVALVHQ